MTGPAPTASGASASEAYESLRAQVTDSTPATSSGMILVLAKGVATWMAERAARPAFAAAAPPAGALVVPGEFHAGIVQVLASIAMARRESA